MRSTLACCLLLSVACTSTLVDYDARTHIVQTGETLYTIAWRYGVDYRSLAAWNNLTNPDLIFAGQRISLSAPSRTSSSPPQPVVETVARAPRRPAPLPDPPVLSAPRWQWPTQGRIVSQFGQREAIASGIGIGGRAGQSINAAASGRVVYAGSGLIGYGQLLIIKHNDTYLSAYGHNSRLLVDQGETVELGEKIAEMGLGPERNPRLHFEIRRNGVPVNPFQYLPARSVEAASSRE